ncbi:hypothetical protein G6F50_018151 [Rhizopus delemar]|uniref:Uncharacterized protein n=1 Tax=Rhizopus delemar TaxID=936053 RepID=A0A9P7BZL5_9FUNG|nr:hypothetical protein G6F50_018151 [Rhizopus delemar]
MDRRGSDRAIRHHRGLRRQPAEVGRRARPGFAGSVFLRQHLQPGVPEPRVRSADSLRRQVQHHARAGRVLGGHVAHRAALQAAPGREVPQRRAVHRRRRGGLDDPRVGRRLAAQGQPARLQGGAQGR